MNQQPQITNYFNNCKWKITSSTQQKIEDKRNNLTLGLPIFSTDVTMNVKEPENEVINLLSSDEESCLSDSSDKTVIIPKYLTPPEKSESPFATPSSKKGTPKLESANKVYYSPNKKRNVTKNSPSKIKKNLASAFDEESSHDTSFDIREERSEDIDTKTTFLLDIINECLIDESMKNLLNDETQAVLVACKSLPGRGLRLVCRLYWRRDGWHRKENLMKIVKDGTDPIPDTLFEDIIDNLCERELINKGIPQNMCLTDFTTRLLKSGELKEVCKKLKIRTQNKNKVDLEEAIDDYCKRTSSIANFFSGSGACSNAKRVLQLMGEHAGPCYKLSEKCRIALYKLYLLSYLGISYEIIREKRLELMLLNDKAQRETFPIDIHMGVDNASVVFETQDQFESYLSAHCIHEEYIANKDTVQRCDIVKKVYSLNKNISDNEMQRYKSMPVWLRRYTPGHVYNKILHEGVTDLKKDKSLSCHIAQCELAVSILTSLLDQDLFRQHRKAVWFNEKALILHGYLQKTNEAAQVLLEGFSSNLTDEEKDILRPRAKNMATLKNVNIDVKIKKLLLAHALKETTLESSLPATHIHKQPMENLTKRKIVFETRLQNERLVQNVEEYALTHYITSGEFTHGSHWEGRIVITIFSLLFWDIIYYTPPGIRGVFLSRYQQLPLDMYTEAFYSNRKTLIDKRLELIDNSNIATITELMELNWNSRPDSELSIVYRSVEWNSLTAIVSCLGKHGLYVLCRRLAKQFHYAHSGFPDLTLWNVHTKKIKFVEVKSDSDSPSMKQIQWMQYLIANGVDTEFCYIGTKTHKKSRQNSSAAE